MGDLLTIAAVPIEAERSCGGEGPRPSSGCVPCGSAAAGVGAGHRDLLQCRSGVIKDHHPHPICGKAVVLPEAVTTSITSVPSA